MENIFKNKFFRIWFIVSASVVAFLLIVSILLSTVFYSLVSIKFGDKRRVSSSGQEVSFYQSDYINKSDALMKSNAVTREICREGITLLKNNGALPLKEGAKISVFGKNSVNLVYGGSGSGSGNFSNAKTIFDSLTAAGYQFNPILKSFYENKLLSGDGRALNPKDLDNGEPATLYTGETPQSKYTVDVKNSYAEYSEAALVVISRIGGEGFDLPRTMKGAQGARNEDDHFLQLDANETDLLAAVCEMDFEHVIVIINSANAMELGFLDDDAHYAYQEKIDGCIWMAGTGTEGVMALGEIMKGYTADGAQFSPSGKLTDTYARNFKNDPTWNNFGTNLSADGDRYKEGEKNKPYYFVDYEEGIYVGYRYYETRYKTEENGDAWYRQNVVFPFGYGLSYTQFKHLLKNKDALSGKEIEKNAKITFEVEIENIGDWSGKDVVQLYVTPPYTMGKIEKSEVKLVGFDKTVLLSPGEKDVLKITIDAYDLASYDYSDANKNGIKGYEIEAGDYIFSLRSDSHNVLDTVALKVSQNVNYQDDPKTGRSVMNLYGDADDQLSTVLSRANWETTWPTVRTNKERTIEKTFINQLKDTTTNSIERYENMPVQSADGEKQLIDMVGVDYYDDSWNEILDRITISEMLAVFNNGAFTTGEINSIGKPKTIESDGPVGFCSFMGSPVIYETCSYCSEIVLAATWNEDLAYKMGESIGNEGILGNLGGDQTPYSGLYAPGVNIHRSPFGGRNFEYMSEDGILTGYMAASEIKGAKSKGVYTYVKHFALNEQETHRSSNGVCTWVTEQAMREVYLIPFEKCVKVGETTAIMSSFNRIGTVWAGGDYRLLTKILRDEWGFNGTVISDFNTNDYMNCRQMAYAGGDLNLATINTWDDFDANSASDVTILRRCVKNILYTTANSNAMNIADSNYVLPYWQIILFAIDFAFIVAIVVWGFFVVRIARKKGNVEK